jgi:hypothetical protein
MFVVGPDGMLYRLSSAKFMEMLRDRGSHSFPRFAGKRVRVAEAIVELRDRLPTRIARLTYDILTFDSDGRLDRAVFERQQFARAELAMCETESQGKIVDASNRFVAQGGQWAPSRALARVIRDAAFGQVKCPRL